jgi:hypothetical protein
VAGFTGHHPVPVSGGREGRERCHVDSPDDRHVDTKGNGHEWSRGPALKNLEVKRDAAKRMVMRYAFTT